MVTIVVQYNKYGNIVFQGDISSCHFVISIKPYPDSRREVPRKSEKQECERFLAVALTYSPIGVGIFAFKRFLERKKRTLSH